MAKMYGIEFKDGELRQLAEAGMYVVKFRTVFQPIYDSKTGEGLRYVYYGAHDRPFTKPGRVIMMDAGIINKLLGFELLEA